MKYLEISFMDGTYYCLSELLSIFRRCFSGSLQNELTASAGGEVSFIVWVVDAEHWFGALCFWDEASESP
jgi:hypothetical protein